jgi:hypothetical protein
LEIKEDIWIIEGGKCCELWLCTPKSHIHNLP